MRDLCKKLKPTAFSIFTKNFDKFGEKYQKILRVEVMAKCSVPYWNLYGNAYQNMSSIRNVCIFAQVLLLVHHRDCINKINRDYFTPASQE